MSEVKRRTVYYHRIKGVIKFLDWATVVFSKNAGRMVEPFMVNQRYLSSQGLREFDATDPAVRIDYMMQVDPDDLPRILSGGVKGGTVLNGGTLTPTIGNGDLVSP